MGGTEAAFQNYTCYSSDLEYRMPVSKLFTQKYQVEQRKKSEFLNKYQTDRKLYRLINVNHFAVFTAAYISQTSVFEIGPGGKRPCVWCKLANFSINFAVFRASLFQSSCKISNRIGLIA